MPEDLASILSQGRAQMEAAHGGGVSGGLPSGPESGRSFSASELGRKSVEFLKKGKGLGGALFKSIGEINIAKAPKAIADSIWNNKYEMTVSAGIGIGVRTGVRAAAIASGFETYVLGVTTISGATVGTIKEYRKISKEDMVAGERRTALKRIMRNKGRLGRAALVSGGLAAVGYLVGHGIVEYTPDSIKDFVGENAGRVKEAVASYFAPYVHDAKEAASPYVDRGKEVVAGGIKKAQEGAKHYTNGGQEVVAAEPEPPQEVGPRGVPASNEKSPARRLWEGVFGNSQNQPDTSGAQPSNVTPDNSGVDRPSVAQPPAGMPSSAGVVEPGFAGDESGANLPSVPSAETTSVVDPSGGVSTRPDFYSPVHSQPPPYLDADSKPTFSPDETVNSNPAYNPNWHEDPSKGGVPNAPAGKPPTGAIAQVGSAPAPSEPDLAEQASSAGAGSGAPSPDAIKSAVSGFDKEILPKGATPWAVAEKLLIEAHKGDPNYIPTPAAIMEVDKALCIANKVAVPEWGIEGDKLATRLPAGMEFKITDQVKSALLKAA